MTPLLQNHPLRLIPLRLAGAALVSAAIIASAAAPQPLLAQDDAAEARVRKLEAEVRALQRKVFPGGDARFFEPQIAPGTPTGTTPAAPATGAVPSATAVTDILVRLDALEVQLQAMTARSEEQANTLSQLEQRLLALETAGAAPALSAPGSAPALQPAPTLSAPAPAPITPAATPTVRPAVPAITPAPSAAAAATGPSAARLAAVQAIAKPQTADAGDDEYSYGFRLWSAGFFPEARQQLTKFVEQYPNHPRISFGRNLLGRAFLDDKMPEDAARWFLRNYQSNKAGDRAPDSLLYLGASMIAMNDTKRACIALAEFAETYPLIASGRLATDYQANRAKVKCN
ncbi:tetratricopeptide repeat protein [Porphyrobacter sp. TH134]|uniref:tetratricopeptide repeat protein n=1 Tax=Porphyrobacter sp. TH134 TaxID=2067450 RepID=UPI001F40954F|nr:tetratricopeptide repeat protein [Porphyrobacter sp. TH134]